VKKITKTKEEYHNAKAFHLFKIKGLNRLNHNDKYLFYEENK